MQAGDIDLDRDDAFVGDRAQELAQEERIAARLRVAGGAVDVRLSGASSSDSESQ